MNTNPHKLVVSALALAVAGIAASGAAHGSAFELRENSVKAQGRAMAGSASATGDASAVANNPALMSTFDAKTFQIDVTAVDLTFEFEGSGNAAAGSPLQQPLQGGDGGNAGGVTPIPAMSFIMPFTGDLEYLTLGAMVSVPFGLSTEYDSDWMGRYHAIESDVRVIDLTLAASVDLHERVSAGFGLIVQHSDVTLSNAIDFGSSLCANPATQQLCFMPDPVTGPYGPQKNDGFAEVSGSDTSIGWTVGLNVHPIDALSLGYAYRSEVKHEVDGDAVFDVPSNVAPILAGTGQFQNVDGGARLVLPATHTFSATWQATDRLALMGEARQTKWSSMDEVRIQFDNPVQPDSVENYNWHDSWFYSIGAEYTLNDRWTLRGGIARDESPISFQHRTPRMPDEDRTWFAVGATWAVTDSWDITGAYTRIHIGDDPELDIVGGGARLTGPYDGGANLFGISAQYKF
ncbi:OmpP1/FadL family transporter [Luteimonas sp. A277]